MFEFWNQWNWLVNGHDVHSLQKSGQGTFSWRPFFLGEVIPSPGQRPGYPLVNYKPEPNDVTATVFQT